MAARALIAALLAVQLAGCQLPADTRHARYQLSLGNTEQARKQLKGLAEAGDPAAQIEYAKLIAADQGSDPAEAMVWYRRAWEQQDYRAGPASLHLYKRYQGSVGFGETRARELLRPLRPLESEQDLSLALDIAVLYPGAVTDRQWQQWLALYRRSCIQDCYFATYAGRYAQHRGDIEEGAQWYEQVLHRDPRAVEYLQDLFWQAGTPERFVSMIRSIEGDVSLDGIYCLRIATLIKANATTAEHDPLVMRWLQRAADKGEPLAMVEQLQYMLAWPGVYSYDEFSEAVTTLTPLDSAMATYFRARGDLREEWFELRPQRAQRDLLALADAGMARAYLPLGELYESGYLGEADMERAVKFYLLAAESGLAQGDVSLARLYSTGKGVARDPVRAYAHREASKVLLPRTARRESEQSVPLPEGLLPAGQQAAGRLIAARKHWLEEQFHVAFTQ
ncbi:alginate biosynthesis regulator [Alcanivorax sp. MD8A]|uniref:tetratricopeptide repeat protein n=1 Tax=Alcanivorax sp. MD8A TaxID=1177157 RepID=UPI000C9C313F|nr:sel1 repeat family protein [Alcanivorax sp. MD8A]PNE02640.1 alginate biosynthesis regulator [Alcanivorax sp. MD8A]